MSTPTTLVKCATAAPSLALCKTTITRAAVIAPGSASFKYFSSDSKDKARDDVPRTATGEPQKLTNLASEIGNRVAKAAPGGEPSGPAASSGGQGHDKGDLKKSDEGNNSEKKE